MRLKHLAFFLTLPLFGLFGTASVWPQSFPERPPQGDLVLDQAQLIHPDDLQQIQAVSQKLFRDQQIPIVVVTIPSLSNYDASDIESYALALFNKWGIGSSEKNYGVLLLVSLGDRKARIELGKGWGDTKNDTAKMIMNDIIVPSFKKGNYSTGILQGVNALDTMVRGGTVRAQFWWLPLVLIVTTLGAGVALGISLIRNGRAGWGWAVLALVGAAIVWLLALASRLPKGSGDSYSGGSSGGDGATGSW